mgnify:CR=1 FL=1
MALEKELAIYKQKLPELMVVDEGKFVLIHGEEVTVFDTYADAIKEGYDRYKLDPFLVQKIGAAEKIQFVTRLFDASCHT